MPAEDEASGCLGIRQWASMRKRITVKKSVTKGRLRYCRTRVEPAKTRELAKTVSGQAKREASHP
jgi:hypothetical protein